MLWIPTIYQIYVMLRTTMRTMKVMSIHIIGWIRISCRGKRRRALETQETQQETDEEREESEVKRETWKEKEDDETDCEWTGINHDD